MRPTIIAATVPTVALFAEQSELEGLSLAEVIKMPTDQKLFVSRVHAWVFDSSSSRSSSFRPLVLHDGGLARVDSMSNFLHVTELEGFVKEDWGCSVDDYVEYWLEENNQKVWSFK